MLLSNYLLEHLNQRSNRYFRAYLFENWRQFVAGSSVVVVVFRRRRRQQRSRAASVVGRQRPVTSVGVVGDVSLGPRLGAAVVLAQPGPKVSLESLFLVFDVRLVELVRPALDQQDGQDKEDGQPKFQLLRHDRKLLNAARTEPIQFFLLFTGFVFSESHSEQKAEPSSGSSFSSELMSAELLV